MAQMNKEFAENLLKRTAAGQHINTTVWEEEQLVRGWLYWYENYYQPHINALARNSAADDGSGSAGVAGSLGTGNEA